VFGAASGDVRGDLEPSDPIAANIVVVAAVGIEMLRAAQRPSPFAADRRHRLERRDQTGHIVAVPAGERHGRRNAVRLDNHVVLAVYRGRAGRRRDGIPPPQQIHRPPSAESEPAHPICVSVPGSRLHFGSCGWSGCLQSHDRSSEVKSGFSRLGLAAVDKPDPNRNQAEPGRSPVRPTAPLGARRHAAAIAWRLESAEQAARILGADSRSAKRPGSQGAATPETPSPAGSAKGSGWMRPNGGFTSLPSPVMGGDTCSRASADFASCSPDI
jgi:hypothetical protein